MGSRECMWQCTGPKTQTMAERVGHCGLGGGESPLKIPEWKLGLQESWPNWQPAAHIWLPDIFCFSHSVLKKFHISCQHLKIRGFHIKDRISGLS